MSDKIACEKSKWELLRDNFKYHPLSNFFTRFFRKKQDDKIEFENDDVCSYVSEVEYGY